MNVKCTILILGIFLSISSKILSQKINGLSFVASREPINQQHITPVLKTNSNYVALMPYSIIRDKAIPKIEFNTKGEWFGETENGLLQYANEFQKSGIHIMVKPHIWLRRGGFTGNLKPNTEEGWKLLESSYRKYILTYAKAAEQLKAGLLCIGTELKEFVLNRPNYWSSLIKEIRSIYSGKLTYAANWDEYKRLSFWGELDFIGIDAYFPLSASKTPTILELEESWDIHKSAILAIQQKFKKPVLFTEFGYRSIDYNAKRPWEFSRTQDKVNLNAQTNALQAIYNQFWGEDWFAGGFLWKWFHNHEFVGGLKNNRFTPQNKPAEVLITSLYANR
ncbi:MAG: glycoside hydrolase [Polaribacter sp.]